PPRHEIETRWMAGDLDGARGPCNLLCAPFPYVVRGGAIEAGPLVQGASGAGHFRVRQTWLPEKEKDRVGQVAQLVRELVKVSEREVGQVHGVVLPELALDSPTVRG